MDIFLHRNCAPLLALLLLLTVRLTQAFTLHQMEKIQKKMEDLILSRTTQQPTFPPPTFQRVERASSGASASATATAATRKPLHCCPAIGHISYPRLGYSAQHTKPTLLEIHQSERHPQPVYENLCARGVAWQPCRYLQAAARPYSQCKPQHGWVVLLARPYGSSQQWRRMMVTIKTGCTCELQNPS